MILVEETLLRWVSWTRSFSYVGESSLAPSMIPSLGTWCSIRLSHGRAGGNVRLGPLGAAGPQAWEALIRGPEQNQDGHSNVLRKVRPSLNDMS